MDRLVVTDSGFGGLSIISLLEQYLRHHSAVGFKEIIYVNAAPSNEIGYNNIVNRVDKLELFQRVLVNIQSKLNPDKILIACNTLSVFLQDPLIQKNLSIPTLDVVTEGSQVLIDFLTENPHNHLLFFATETTIEEGSYQQILDRSGISEDRLFFQACPNLATTISNDLDGEIALDNIRNFSQESLGKIPQASKNLGVYLGCTHYSFRRNLFAQALREKGIFPRILMPNQKVVHQLIDKKSSLSQPACLPSIRFISRYILPKREVTTVSRFLSAVSPITTQALRSYQYINDFF